METKLLTGVIQSGGPANPRPLQGVSVTVYEATWRDPLIVGHATTNAEGRFELHMERDKCDYIFYATATVDQGIELVTIIGPALHLNEPAWITAPETASDADEHSPGNTASITINELTTVAAAFSMAQFTQNGLRGGGVNGPWGTTIDGDDNVWVANFVQMLPGADYTSAAISNLAGANADTRPPGFETGEPISPPSGYTLPSAGSQVLLYNREPLYGPGQEPCYSPLMRQTSCVIDQAETCEPSTTGNLTSTPMPPQRQATPEAMA